MLCKKKDFLYCGMVTGSKTVRRDWWGGPVVVRCCKICYHRLAGFRPQDAWFPSYGRFKFLRCLGLGNFNIDRDVGCPTRKLGVYGNALQLDQVDNKVHWGKVVLPLVLVHFHWYWHKWRT